MRRIERITEFTQKEFLKNRKEHSEMDRRIKERIVDIYKSFDIVDSSYIIDSYEVREHVLSDDEDMSIVWFTDMSVHKGCTLPFKWLFMTNEEIKVEADWLKCKN